MPPSTASEIGSTLYFNPLQSGSVKVAIQALDARTGVSQVDFPILGAGWAPAGAIDATGPYSLDYAWSAGAVDPGAQNAVARDNAGNTSVAGFTITADASAPAGGSVGSTNGLITVATADVTFTAGADALSGIATWQLERSSAPYAASVCGAFGAFSAIGPASPGSPYTDATLVDLSCYRYRLVVLDNVGNSSTFAGAATLEVDTP